MLMAIRLVRKEVPQMSDRSATTLVSVGRSPPPYFEAGKVGEISNARACHRNAKAAIPGVMEELPIWVGR